MPLLRVTTNKIIAESEQKTIIAEISASVAAILNKPESYVMIILQSDSGMLFGGSDAPLAYLELKSLGLPEDRTGEFSSALCSVVSRLMGIPHDRTYIEFASPPRHFWGWNNSTF